MFEKVATITIKPGPYGVAIAEVTRLDGGTSVHHVFSVAGRKVWTDGGAFKSRKDVLMLVMSEDGELRASQPPISGMT